MKIEHLLYGLILMLLFTGIASTQDKNDNAGPENAANRYLNRVDVDRLIHAFESPSRAEWQKPYEVIELFGDVEGKTIMDLGAGSGYFTFRLAREGAHVIAADVNEEFQDFIREKKQEKAFESLAGNIELRKVEYDDPLLEKEEVDGLLIVNTYHHIEDRVEYLRKTLKGIKPGGKLIIVDYKTGIPGGPPEHHKLGLDVASGEVAQVGFSRITIDKEMLERQYVIIGEK